MQVWELEHSQCRLVGNLFGCRVGELLEQG